MCSGEMNYSVLTIISIANTSQLISFSVKEKSLSNTLIQYEGVKLF